MQIVAQLILFKKGSHNFFAQVHTFQDNWQKRCDGRKPAAILVFRPSPTGIFENRFFFTKNLNFGIDCFRFWWIPTDQKKNPSTKLLQLQVNCLPVADSNIKLMDIGCPCWHGYSSPAVFVISWVLMYGVVNLIIIEGSSGNWWFGALFW